MNNVWIRRCLALGGVTMAAACSACWALPLLGLWGLGGVAFGRERGVLPVEIFVGALGLLLAVGGAAVVRRLRAKATAGGCRPLADPSSPVDASRRPY